MTIAGVVATGVATNVIATALIEKGFSFGRKLIYAAARRLRPTEARRFEQEWLAHLEDCDGSVHAFTHALGCVVASYKICWPLERPASVYRFWIISSLAIGATEKLLGKAEASGWRSVQPLTKNLVHWTQLMVASSIKSVRPEDFLEHGEWLNITAARFEEQKDRMMVLFEKPEDQP